MAPVAHGPQESKTQSPTLVTKKRDDLSHNDTVPIQPDTRSANGTAIRSHESCGTESPWEDVAP